MILRMAANSLISHILIHVVGPDVEKACLVGNIYDKSVTDWAFQIALSLSNVVLPYQLVDVHISLQ